jgi:hypothetical protein
LKLIDEAEFYDLLKMLDDRNLTSHAHREELAKGISSRAKAYHAIMHVIVLRIANISED